MAPLLARTPRGRRGAVALLALGAADAVALAATTPFTVPADVMTGVPLVVLAALVLLRWPWHPARRRPVGAHPSRAWALWFGAVLAWELAEYAQTDRHAHPTLSSLADTVDSHVALKAAVFLGWLCLGWLILSKGETAAAGDPPALAPGPVGPP